MPERSSLRLIRRKLTVPEMRECLEDAIIETNSLRKGEKFERFFENFMNQQKGFVFIDKHCRSKVGEIDYFYRNELHGHPLWERYPYLFIECKNWKERIGSDELNHFIRLLKAKKIFNCCGIYLTTSSFSSHALATVRDARIADRLMILLIDKNDLSKLIDQGFKNFLQEKCDRTLAKA